MPASRASREHTILEPFGCLTFCSSRAILSFAFFVCFAAITFAAVQDVDSVHELDGMKAVVSEALAATDTLSTVGITSPVDNAVEATETMLGDSQDDNMVEDVKDATPEKEDAVALALAASNDAAAELGINDHSKDSSKTAHSSAVEAALEATDDATESLP